MLKNKGKNRKRNLFLFFILFPAAVLSQRTYTLSGKIADSETGEDMIGVTVLVAELSKGTTSNSYGFYSISLPSGKYTIRYSYVGYKNEEKILDLKNNQLLNVEIVSSVLGLGEVIVSSEKDNLNLNVPETGLERINLKEIVTIPVLLGERDILKTIQFIPGVSNSTEGSTGYNVRGGSMGNNLLLLDEAPVYGSSHMMGFFSVFNSDAIKEVTLYKGGIPACYGGRSSSVLDVKMNNGNSKNFSTSGGIGLISSRLLVEGPLIKDKMSFMITGRRTYADLIAKLIFPDKLVSDKMSFYFFDLNAKINYTINSKDRIFISGYFGKDIFELGDDIGTGWGNTTGTLRWNHVFSNRIFSNTALIYSKYDYGFIFGQKGLRLKSGIEDISFKEDVTVYFNSENTLKSGIGITYHSFSPGKVTIGDTSGYQVTLREKKATEGYFYIQDEQKITSRLISNYGVRLSYFAQLGPGWFYSYNVSNELVDSLWFGNGKAVFPRFYIEPRISFNYLLNRKSSIKLSCTRMTQYLHLLSNSTSGSPTDIWMPSSNNLFPSIVDQISVGYFRNFQNNSFETSVEVYYKNIINAVDYEDGAEIIFNEHVESQILSGKGRGYGLELYAKKTSGNLTGWISYTLSRIENKIKGINNFNWYPVKFDKTHIFSLVAIYKISKKLSLSGDWTFMTGNAVTFPGGKYELLSTTVPYYTERNGYRMPAYHRLDLGLAMKGKTREKFRSEWNFSIYNIYNRHNAYAITFRESEAGHGTTEAVRLSLFGIVPSISYNFIF
jgi:hypothetical protein